MRQTREYKVYPTSKESGRSMRRQDIQLVTNRHPSTYFEYCPAVYNKNFSLPKTNNRRPPTTLQRPGKFNTRQDDCPDLIDQN